jgi:predicted  nucleic acid-binding Zn-ribbon protein
LGTSEPVVATCVKDVDVADQTLKGLETSIKEGKKSIDELNTIAKKVTDAGADPTVFARFNLESLKSKYETANKEVADKKIALAQERKKQEANEKQIHEFDDACEKYTKFIQDTLSKLQAEQKGSLEEQLAALTKIGGAATTQSTNLYPNCFKVQMFSKKLILWKIQATLFKKSKVWLNL